MSVLQEIARNTRAHLASEYLHQKRLARLAAHLGAETVAKLAAAHARRARLRQIKEARCDHSL